MRELNLHEIQAISGANYPNEGDIVLNGIAYGLMGYCLASGTGYAPFYPSLIAAAYGFIMTAYEATNQND